MLEVEELKKNQKLVCIIKLFKCQNSFIQWINICWMSAVPGLVLRDSEVNTISAEKERGKEKNKIGNSGD